ncbi:MAG: metallophosphoesterase family protein [Sphaerochaetaceae bacterium]|nr:metallophosphoesterase family protein [Sphaerochaetaceae bacterium]
MRLALLSDIHGNSHALDAVLADGAECHIDQYILLGDTVFNGLFPKRCIERLSDLPILASIKGNTDANIENLENLRVTTKLEGYIKDLAVFTVEELSSKTVGMLKNLRIREDHTIEGHSIIFCHGSPYSFKEQLKPHGETLPSTAAQIASEDVDLICCGHTHRSGDFSVGNVRVINPGAVGYSFDSNWRPSYAVLDIDSEGINCEIRKISYDRDIYIRDLKKYAHRFPLLESVIYAVQNGEQMPDFFQRFK